MLARHGGSSICPARCSRNLGASLTAPRLLRHSHLTWPVVRRGLATKRYSLRGGSAGRAGCAVQTSTGFGIATDIPRVPHNRSPFPPHFQRMACSHSRSFARVQAVGGANLAPQPVELFLAALVGCKTATAHFVARQLWPRGSNEVRPLCSLSAPSLLPLCSLSAPSLLLAPLSAHVAKLETTGR